MKCPIDGAVMKEGRHDWLLICPRCGLEGSTLEPDIASGARSDGIAEGVRQRGLSSVRTANGQQILSVIVRSVSGRRILDVGSGPGFFITLAERAGFSAAGVEPDAPMAAQSRARGQKVYAGYFPDALPAHAAFDVIVLNDVLEHIPDIQAVFSGVHRHLADSGLLIVNSPDRNGILYRIASLLDRMGVRRPFQRMWQMGLPSPHVWYFARRQLRDLCEARGFDFVGNIDLLTLSRDGLYERISYVQGQGKLFNLITFAVMWVLVPLLHLLPSDIGAVAVRKNAASHRPSGIRGATSYLQEPLEPVD